MNDRLPTIIRPGVGFGDIKFGMRTADVIAILGSPRNASTDEDGDSLLEYPEQGVALLVFDISEQDRLVTYELTEVSNAKLWGLNVFALKRSEMMQQAAVMGKLLEHCEQSHGDEHDARYRIKNDSLNFYYNGQDLTAVMGGVVFTRSDSIQWP